MPRIIANERGNSIADANAGFAQCSDAEQDANARLIAASPDLYAALLALVRADSMQGTRTAWLVPILDRADAALAKAGVA